MDAKQTAMLPTSVMEAVRRLGAHGRRLRDDYHFDWPEVIQQAVGRLCWELSESTGIPDSGLSIPSGSRPLPTLVAIVGGASAGKSTVFNNLLEGRSTSRITARGHTTRGPVMAAHEKYRDSLEHTMLDDSFFSGLSPLSIELDDNACGEPGTLAMVFHQRDTLRDVLLFDMPDFSSELARREGDLTWNLLPWFDRLIVVIDHERWFDRQSISGVRAEAARFGQERFVLFNRTLEGDLSDAQQALLLQQAERLGASGMLVLEFRRGRGLSVFAPSTFDALFAFFQRPPASRRSLLLTQVAEMGNRVLNQNEDRAARLETLRDAVGITVEHCLPTAWECMTALMTPAERQQLEPASRVLRLGVHRRWLGEQARRLREAFGGLPMAGTLTAPWSSPADNPASGAMDRGSVGERYYEAWAQRQAHDVTRTVQGSLFWAEIRRWTGLSPAPLRFEWTLDHRRSADEAVEGFDRALKAWTAKVESECQGLSPHLRGAVGVGVLALAIVLVAVPGPVTALSLIAAKGAIGAALTHVLTAAGLGAVFGKHVGRLTEVIREKLVGSPEFDAVRQAAGRYRLALESAGRETARAALDQASALVLPTGDPTRAALETLRDFAESAT